MPVVGERRSTASMGRGYAKDPMAKYAAQVNELVRDIHNEAGVDMYLEPHKALRFDASKNAMKNFFVSESFDASEFSAEDIEDQEAMMEAQFENDCEGILEHTALSSFNPVVGMTLPIHKNILMNNVFDKGAIPKVVSAVPVFPISMEKRLLIAPDGTEIDMYKEQHKMRAAIDSTAPYVAVTMNLPEVEGATDVLTAMGATAEDNLDVASYISAVQVPVYLETGDINPETKIAAIADGVVDVWLPTKLMFTPNYGEYDRTIMEGFTFKTKDSTDPTKILTQTDVLAGYTKKNRFSLSSQNGIIKAVKLSARLDTSSAMLKTCSVSWKVRTDIVEIGTAPPINVPISPEEVKDIGALYNVNQLTKVMSLIKLALGNYKDDKIKSELDTSFQTMDDDSKIATTFDFAPPNRYALDHIEWRYKTFMQFLDNVVTGMMQVLNDPNMTVSVFGAPDLIRSMTPTEYTYQTPSNIGPVDLDFVKTVVTSDKRVYQFLSTDKLRGNTNLIICLCPRNSDRIVYRIYDYQMYISNEIRNMANPALPAIHAFERWKFMEYQPVQGRVKVLNPTGLTQIAANDDPIGTSTMNDWSMIKGTP